MIELENALRSVARALDERDKRIDFLIDSLRDTTKELLELRRKLVVVEQALARATKGDVTA